MQPAMKQVVAIQVISRTDRLTIPRIPAHSGPAIHSLIEALERRGIAPLSGECIYVYHGCNGDPSVEFDLEICLPVPPATAGSFEVPVALKSLPPFKCVAVEYTGPMTGIGSAWMQLVQAVQSSGSRPTAESREVYKKWIEFDSPENVTELQQAIE